MKKPILKKEIKEYYDFFECRDYIKNKYNFSDEWMKIFWKYLCEYRGVNNDSYFGLGIEDQDRPMEGVVSQVWDAFKSEFGAHQNYISFYVSW